MPKDAKTPSRPDDGPRLAAVTELKSFSGAALAPEQPKEAAPEAAQVSELGEALIFRTRSPGERDLAELGKLRQEAGETRVILALTGAQTTLAEARRLAAAGASEVLPDTTPEEELRALAEKLAAPKAAAPQPAPAPALARAGRVIAVMPARGGIGASTLAVNLADRLRDPAGTFRKTARNRVVVVDLDIQFGTISSLLDTEPREFLYDLALDGRTPDAQAVEEALIELPSGLSVLPAPSQFAPLETIRPEQIKALIAHLRSRYDYVVLDLPRTLVGWAGAVFEVSDRLFLMADSTVPTIRQARRLLDLLAEDHLDLSVEVVLNHERKPMTLSRAQKEASKVLQKPFRHWLPDDPRAARMAVDRGQPLTEVAGRAPLARAIDRLCRSTMAELKAADKDTKETGSRR